jgi:hypothetical protein
MLPGRGTNHQRLQRIPQGSRPHRDSGGPPDADPDAAKEYAAAAEWLVDDIPDDGERGVAWGTIAEVVAVTDPAWSLRLADKAQTGMLDDMDWGGTVSIAIALSAAGTHPHQLLRRVPGDFLPEIFFPVEVRSFIETDRWKEAERLCGDMWSRDDDEGDGRNWPGNCWPPDAGKRPSGRPSPTPGRPRRRCLSAR